MTLQDLGYSPDLETHRQENGWASFSVARVISEHKERYMVKTAEEEFDAEILGNLRYTAQNRSDFPAVGDWVAISEYDDGKALIHGVFPRKSIIERQAIGKKADKQIIATNIDQAFIVQAVDRDFSLNRFERYITICNASKVEPIIILSKTDLIDEESLSTLIETVKQRIKHVSVFAISNQSQKGIEELKATIEKGKTYCLLGSSGVGKSSLLNSLLGEDLMKTNTINEHIQRGRHVTTHRELKVFETGGILIDNPGMREVGITESGSAIEATFETIAELASNCRFKDCTHTHEKGCAILEAIENGELDEALYQNYLKMHREQEHFSATLAEKRKKDKDFGKMIKDFKKNNYKKF